MYVVFDIGGTKMRVSTSTDGQTLSPATVYATPQSYQEGIHLLIQTITELSAGRTLQGIAGGLPGPLDTSKYFLLNAPNLLNWVNQPIKESLSQTFQTNILLENDAALAGLGEAHFGAGKGRKVVVYLTLSTGVGGTRIVAGSIDKNAFGFEPGHQIIDPKGPMCHGCHTQGHLEAFIGGASLTKRFGQKPEDITDPKIWEEVAAHLAVGLNNITVLWSPEVIVLGGPLVHKIDLYLVQKNVQAYCHIFPQLPLLVPASLQDNALFGALTLLQS